MKYEVMNKPYFKEVENRTEVQIYAESPYTVITRNLVGDWTKKKEEELIQGVIDQLAMEYDPSDKIVELDSIISKANEKLESFEKVVDEAVSNLEIVQGAMIELMELVYAQLGTDEGGEVNDGDVTSN